MRSSTAVIVCILAVTATCNWADHIPLCLFPQVFPVSMKVSPAKVDVSKYMGRWFEVARMPTPFQKDCDCSEANYSLNSEGSVKVYNKCVKSDGSTSDITGKAYPKNAHNTKLNVYFAGPFPGAYWILDIEENYEWVVVGEPCKKMAWILSRTAQLPADVLAARIETLVQKGFDVSQLVYRADSC